MKIATTIRNSFLNQSVSIATNDNVKQVTIAPKPNSLGSSIDGGELLLLSLATCYCNDLYREARKLNIAIESIEVSCTAEFGAEGEPGSNFQYSANIISNASPDRIEELLIHTDKVAEVHNTLRKGVDVKLQLNKEKE